MTNKKGFTLIELLAVIVILAIIALITAPLVVGIITNSRESSNKVSATNYIRAVNTAITTASIDNTLVEDGYYEITKDGNICLEELNDGECTGNKLKIKVNVNKPIKGNVMIESEEIVRAYIVFKEFSIELSDDGQMEYFAFAKKYELGEEVTFNPGDGNKTWSVLGEDANTVTLMLNEDFGDKVAWYSEQNNTYGPITALNYLNTLTTNYTNVDPIDNYVYINNENGDTVPNGYQKLEIKDGIAKTISQSGEENQITGETKARLITVEEVTEILQKYDENFREENLRAYIERNLGAINNLLSSQGLNTVSTVDEAISTYVSMNTIWANDSKYLQTLRFVIATSIDYGIEPTFLSMPTFLNSEIGYWTLTARPSVNTSAFYFKNSLVSNHANSANYKVRPVITIQKSKLS